MTRYNPRTGAPTEYQVGPFDAPHLYLQWGGKLPGSEEWSCGMRFASTGGTPTDTDPASMLAGVTSAVQTFHTAAASLIHTDAKLSFVKLNRIGTDGHYILPTTYEQIVADVSGGGGAGIRYPNSVAWVVSLTTGVSRGPAHRGRFYVPMPVAAVQTDGSFNTTAQDSLGGTVDTLISVLNGQALYYRLAVFSRKAGAPTHRLVTGNEVGKTPDTQRRRRNKLLEVYR